MRLEEDASDDEVRRSFLLYSSQQVRVLKDDGMNPGGGHMSYPGGGGGYPAGGGSYGYGSQYMSPGAGYHHHTTVPPGQMSPYGPGGLGVMGGQPPPQTSPYSGEQFNNKTPPFQQSFQRPYSPTGFPYGGPASGMRPAQLGGHLHLGGGGGQDAVAVDLKTSSSMYSGQNYSAAHQNSSPYGYNGFGHSPHHQTSSYNSPDPNKPTVDSFGGGDNLSRRHFENYYDKSSGDASPVENKPSNSDSNLISSMCDEDKNVADDLSMRRNDESATSRNGGGDDLEPNDEDQKDFKPGSASLIDNLDSIPFIPDIPDIKPDDISRRDHPDDPSHRHPGSDPSSPMRNRGLKRSHSPSIDAQDSESQDSYGGGGPVPPPQGMIGGPNESEFNQGMNDAGQSNQILFFLSSTISPSKDLKKNDSNSTYHFYRLIK